MNIQYSIISNPRNAAIPVAHAAPAIPIFNMYMNIGSSIMLDIAVVAIGIVALLMSPSALNAPPIIGGISTANDHENITIPYSIP